MDGYIGSDGRLVAYAAGACTNNGADGARAGVGVFWGDRHARNVSERLQGAQTNNRAVLSAVLRAIKDHPFDDSASWSTPTHSFRNYREWRSRGWRNSSGRVKNLDLVLALAELVESRRFKISVEDGAQLERALAAGQTHDVTSFRHNAAVLARRGAEMDL